MERIIDYLAEELKREEAKQTRRTQKKQRISKMLTDLKINTELPVMDFLGD